MYVGWSWSRGLTVTGIKILSSVYCANTTISAPFFGLHIVYLFWNTYKCVQNWFDQWREFRVGLYVNSTGLRTSRQVFSEKACCDKHFNLSELLLMGFFRLTNICILMMWVFLRRVVTAFSFSPSAIFFMHWSEQTNLWFPPLNKKIEKVFATFSLTILTLWSQNCVM